MKNLTEKDKTILRDMAAFIQWGLEGDERMGYILGNLGHDIGGILHKEELFSPRTKGFAKVVAKK